MGHVVKLRIQLKSNWIFSEFWFLIYIYIYIVGKKIIKLCLTEIVKLCLIKIVILCLTKMVKLYLTKIVKLCLCSEIHQT